MAIIINIDVMMAKRKMSLGELAERTTAATTDGSTGGNGQNVVNTGDKSPVDVMFAIMIASLIMAGAGYIVIKKDKK